MSRHDPSVLPADLPVPADDGAADHLVGREMPALSLPSTSGDEVDLRAASRGRAVVIFCYPRTGRPGVDPPTDWDLIPGARGCTPEACAFRDLKDEFDKLDVGLFGLSAQDTAYQTEAADRLHLTYPLLSDVTLQLTQALQLSTFEVDGETFVRRQTLVVRDGRIDHVFYPVFPPDRHPDDVVAWLRSRSAPSTG